MTGETERIDEPTGQPSASDIATNPVTGPKATPGVRGMAASTTLENTSTSQVNRTKT
ncbi:hypothetical protein [Salinadaptatus halalkaliphilus]|uniref:hypothetical protein n=1 Tax=Salinadaptatus halalkaliphilus TaxID=2419781 RepID=UPI0015802E25|nr:hypothetical protein [Salinadaptatus halalkaliphilus]